MVMTMILTQLMAKSSGLKQNAFYHTCTEARRFNNSATDNTDSICVIRG